MTNEIITANNVIINYSGDKPTVPCSQQVSESNIPPGVVLNGAEMNITTTEVMSPADQTHSNVSDGMIAQLHGTNDSSYMESTNRGLNAGGDDEVMFIGRKVEQKRSRQGSKLDSGSFRPTNKWNSLNQPSFNIKNRVPKTDKDASA